MISNLFSIFDPSTYMSTAINWTSRILFVIVLTPSIWVISNKTNIFLNKIKNILYYEFKNILGKRRTKGSLVILISIFIFILINNFLGIYPYIFTATRHITITLSLALPLWIGLMIYGWFNQTIYMFAHLVPQRTPRVLIPFIVLIESIRNIIRPGTLAVRLTANIVAGHLLITLLGNQTAERRGIILALLINIQLLLITLEIAVSMIQSYVFVVLITLYTREIHSN